jgi:hypothetical protein
VSAEQNGPTLRMTNLRRPLSGMQVYVITFHTGHRNVSRHSSHGTTSILAARWAPLLEYKTPVNTDTYQEQTFSWKLIFLQDISHINKQYTSIQVTCGYHQIYCQNLSLIWTLGFTHITPWKCLALDQESPRFKLTVTYSFLPCESRHVATTCSACMFTSWS